MDASIVVFTFIDPVPHPCAHKIYSDGTGSTDFHLLCVLQTCRGLKPPSQAKPQQALTKQEIAEVCRRRSVEEMDESEERIKGIGFQR